MKYESEMFAELISVTGDDVSICQWARASTATKEDADSVAGLINYLVKERHGSVFESVGFKFRVTAPIFVLRQLMRHRHSSYCEQSGRYTKFEPMFWLPRDDRRLKQTNRRTMALVSQEVMDFTRDEMMVVYSTAWGVYQALLAKGVAKEVARVVLPVGTYSTVMMSLNLRSLMNVLSLRINAPDATVPSYPQQEIEELAMKFEKVFCEKVPMTYRAWNDYGRNSI